MEARQLSSTLVFIGNEPLAQPNGLVLKLSDYLEVIDWTEDVYFELSRDGCLFCNLH